MSYTFAYIEGLDEPLDFDRLKNEIKVDDAFDNDLIWQYIIAAREYCENYCQTAFRKRLITALVTSKPAHHRKGWYQTYTSFDWHRLVLPLGPATELVSVEIKNADGTYSIVPLSEYNYDPDMLTVAVNRYVEISPRWSPQSQYRVVYEAGIDTEQVPQVVLKAMAMLVGDMYENRNNNVASALSGVQSVTGAVIYSTHQLLAPYRKKVLF